jgi:hypothetical protein
MTGEELRKQALAYIQIHPYVWKRWVEAREEWQRQEIMLEVITQYVARICIAEVYAADESSDAADAIVKHFNLEG